MTQKQEQGFLSKHWFEIAALIGTLFLVLAIWYLQRKSKLSGTAKEVAQK